MSDTYFKEKADRPLISVIIPIHNSEQYLDKCIESVTGQSYKNLEIILVDDGSADGSGSICDKWSHKDGRIVVVHQSNQGVSASRNHGLSLIRGEYLVFVDSDDWVESDMCSGAYSAAVEYDADVVMWSYVREYENRSARKNIFSGNIYFDEKSVRDCLCRRIVGLIDQELQHPENGDALSVVWGKLYRVSVIRESGLQFVDTDIIGTHEDGLFNFEFFRKAKSAVFIEQYWNHYRKTVEGQLTTVVNENRAKGSMNFINVLKNKIDEDNELKNDPRFYEALNNRTCLDVISQAFNICRFQIGLSQKKQKIHDFISERTYKTAFKRLSLNYFPLHWKIFFWCCKKGMAGTVLLMAECMIKIKKGVG